MDVHKKEEEKKNGRQNMLQIYPVIVNSAPLATS